MQRIIFSTDDHSRVLLEKIEGDPKSDYINASYIPVSFIPLIFRSVPVACHHSVFFFGKWESPMLMLIIRKQP